MPVYFSQLSSSRYGLYVEGSNINFPCAYQTWHVIVYLHSFLKLTQVESERSIHTPFADTPP